MNARGRHPGRPYIVGTGRQATLRFAQERTVLADCPRDVRAKGRFAQEWDVLVI